MGNGEVAAGAVLVAVLAAIGWSYLASLWASFLETCLPLLFVALALAAASGWGFLGSNGDGGLGGSGTAGGRHAPPGRGWHMPGLPPAPPAPAQQPGGPEGHNDAAREQQKQPPSQGQEQQLRRSSRNSSALEPVPQAAGQVLELARVKSSGGAGSRHVVTISPGDSSKSTSSQALVPQGDDSRALVMSAVASFSCPKPLGCGFRHGCPDAGRCWMSCDRHLRHPAPPDGSVWREAVPTDQPFAGSHRLLLSWGGRVLDATELGQCRGWDRQITDISTALLDSGTRVAGMCSQSHRFPRLEKFAELSTMDPRAAARGRRLWGMFERWLARKQRGSAAQLAAIAGAPAEPS